MSEFNRHVGRRGARASRLTRESVFEYVYAVLHDPIYREKYGQNLRRE
jgi:predicted helicase